jgi:hypothetical protein
LELAAVQNDGQKEGGIRVSGGEMRVEARSENDEENGKDDKKG